MVKNLKNLIILDVPLECHDECLMTELEQTFVCKDQVGRRKKRVISKK
jgi:hypothetical protein